VFTEELEAALRAGDIDVAVHSLKDLPIEEANGVTIGAVPAREDVRDALVAGQHASLDSLPHGATVGTSSLRRSAQLLAYRRDLQVRSIRGNVETRIRKVDGGEYDAAVLAAAGLRRLNLEKRASEMLSLDVMLPAPGQGALAVQCRTDDSRVRAICAQIDDANVRRAVEAERAFLHGLGGGCAAPVAAYAMVEGKRIQMRGLVAAPDGERVVRVSGSADDPFELARELVQQAAEQGAAELFA
jgi:hydroxymethylbilane synthase